MSVNVEFVTISELSATTTEVKSVKKSEMTARKSQEQITSEFEKLRTAFDELNSRFIRSQDDVAKSNSLTQSLQREVNSLKLAYNTAESSLREMSIDSDKFKAEFDAVVSERDSLLALTEHQKSVLSVQARRSEDSVKSLWDRQEALERVEKDADYSINQLVSVQEGLQGLLAREGILMHSELLGVKKLLGLLSSVRERLLEINSIRSELEEEKSLRAQLEQGFVEGDSESQNTIFQQLTKYRKAYEASEAKAAYWQSVAQKGVSGPADESVIEKYVEENESLRSQLANALAEVAVANDSLEKSQENMQREFSSLWLAVQELNKLDSAKERALAELISDRDRLAGERDAGTKRFHDLSLKYTTLQHDLEVMVNDFMLFTESAVLHRRLIGICWQLQRLSSWYCRQAIPFVAIMR
jgi:chromosome segregation ATPase